MKQLEILEWPNAISDKIERAVRGYVANTKDNEKPVEERLREACGMVIAIVDGKQLREMYSGREEPIGSAINTYVIIGTFLASPEAATNLQLEKLRKDGDERRMVREAFNYLNVREKSKRLLKEDPSGLELLKSLKSFITDSYGATDAVMKRFGQLYNHFGNSSKVGA